MSVETTASVLTAKPALVRCAAMKLRVSSAATTSSSAVIAICAATSASRSVQRRPPARDASPRPADRRRGSAWSPAAPAPGPASSAARNVAASVNASTRPSIRRSKASGIGSGRLSDATTDVIHQASSVPPAAPSSDSTTASVTSWRISRPRLAPIARRMPISFCRLDARASSMLATLAHAISSTRPTTDHQPGGDRHARPGPATGGSARRSSASRAMPPIPVGRRIVGGEPRRQQREVGARLLDRSCPASSRPRMNSQRSARRSSRVVPVGDGTASCIPTGSTSSDADTGIHISGRENRHHPAEAGRRHADDRVRRAADAQRAADRVRRRRQLARPVAVRHHHHPRRARHVVRRKNRAAERGARRRTPGNNCR